MFLIPLLLLLFLFQGFASDCFTHLVSLDSLPLSLECGAPKKYTKDDLDLPPSGSRELLILLTIEPIDACVNTGFYNFLTVSIIPKNTPNTRQKVMQLTSNGVGDTIRFSYSDSSTTSDAHSESPAAFYGVPLSLFISVSLKTKNILAGFLIGSSLKEISSPTTLSYDNNWVFDDSTEITVCSDLNNQNSIKCKIHNLKVAYSMNSISSAADFIGKVKYLADYKLDEGTGLTLGNSVGALSDITLSDPSPSWNPEGGLNFTDLTQSIKIPSFIPSGSDPAVVTSLAFALYIKIDAPPTGYADLAFYYAKSISIKIFWLVLSYDMTLFTYIDGVPVAISSKLKVGEWTSIYASYIYTRGGLAKSVVHINGVKASEFVVSMPAKGTAVFGSNDIISIGPGLIGELKRVQIFSPAVLELKQGTCAPSSCDVASDDTLFPTCLLQTCPILGYYYSLGSCAKCSTGCATCADSSTCLTCYPGDGLYNHRCGACPAETYLSSNRICEPCPTHCKTCIDAQTCQSCKPGYGLFDDRCQVCPAGTYLSSSQVCKEFSETLKDTLKDSQLANSAVTQAANMVSRGSSLSLSAMIAGKIFSLIKHLNISYSGELQEALLTWESSFVSLGLTPDLPESSIDKFPKRSVPYVFEKYEVSSSFLVNFWENLGIIILGATLWFLLKVIQPRANLRINAFIRRCLAMIQNFTLAALYGVYGDLILFAIIEYRTFVFGWNLSMLSFITSIILFFAMAFTFFHQIKILLLYQKIKKSSPNDSGPLEKFKKEHAGSQLFFNDFKDYSYSPQLFPLFLTGRDMIFSLILVTMFEYPLPQTIMMIILNLLMVVYLLIKKPFESTLDFVQQIFFEVIGMIVCISCFLNAIFDSGNYQALQARDRVGKLVIIANIIFNFVTAALMAIVTVQALIEFYKEQKQKQVKKLADLEIKNRIQAFSPVLNTSQPEEIQSMKSIELDNQSLLQAAINRNTSNQNESISFHQDMSSFNRPSNSHVRLRQKRNFNINSESHHNTLHTNESALPMKQPEIQMKKFEKLQPPRKQKNPLPQDLIMPEVNGSPETRPKRR